MPPPTNVPIDRTALFGRDDERADVAALLARDDVGLLTLTGIGGTGKTRLALAVAGDVADRFPDGVWFVDLAPVRDAEHVPAAIARVLGVRERSDRSMADVIATAVGPKRVLLVIDNCEHVLEATTLVGHVLDRCSGLKVLATSRSPIGVYGEHEMPVAPLPVVDLGPLGDRPLAGALSLVERSPAVALFVARAQAVHPGFALTTDNAHAVVELCRGLDGLPLAIELAAGRTRLLSPAAMCERLDRQLSLLTGGARGRPARQQTMRASLAWSYGLLADEERMVLRQLGVFVGGFTMAAAVAVGVAAGAADVEAALGALVGRGLVRPLGIVAGEERFGLLETIREYALEMLTAAGEDGAARAAHARWCHTFATIAGPALRGAQGQVAMARVDAELPNVRAALEDLVGPGGDLARALAIAAELGLFWDGRGHFAEGRRWLIRSLDTADVPAARRIMGLNVLGLLSVRLGDNPQAQRAIESALALARAEGDAAEIGRILNNLGHVAQGEGRYADAERLCLESLAIVRGSGDRRAIAVALNNVGLACQAQGDPARARPFYEESLALARSLGEPLPVVNAMLNLGTAIADQGEVATARRHLEEALALARETGYRLGVAVTLGHLGLLALRDGAPREAARRSRESLRLHAELAYPSGMAHIVRQIAVLAGWPLLVPSPWRRDAAIAGGSVPPVDDLKVAVRLIAATFRPAAEGDAAPDRDERKAAGPHVAALKAALGRGTFAAVWATGEAIGLSGAVAEALAVAARLAERDEPARPAAAAAAAIAASPHPDPPNAPQTRAPLADDGGLTPRELDVAALVAAGLTYAEMAERLSVSVKAIEKHMGNILAKLDARNRREVAVWGRARGL